MKRRADKKGKPSPTALPEIPVDAPEFGRRSVELSRKARAEALRLLSVAEINKEVARQCAPKNGIVYDKQFGGLRYMDWQSWGA